jgi:hypothetical protein
MVSLVSLVVWRDAVKDPPYEGVCRFTDQGEGRYWQRSLLHPVAGWVYDCDTDTLMDPQPTVWCDPAPPTKDGLTVEDVRLALRYAEHGSRGLTGPIPEAIARLRAALPEGDKPCS